MRHLARSEWVDDVKDYYWTRQMYLGNSRLKVDAFNVRVKAIKSSCLAKGKAKLYSWSESKQILSRSTLRQRSEYTIYPSATPGDVNNYFLISSEFCRDFS